VHDGNDENIVSLDRVEHGEWELPRQTSADVLVKKAPLQICPMAASISRVNSAPKPGRAAA
jgi:hypothetical protein